MFFENSSTFSPILANVEQSSSALGISQRLWRIRSYRIVHFSSASRPLRSCSWWLRRRSKTDQLGSGKFEIYWYACLLNTALHLPLICHFIMWLIYFLFVGCVVEIQGQGSGCMGIHWLLGKHTTRLSITFIFTLLCMNMCRRIQAISRTWIASLIIDRICSR